MRALTLALILISLTHSANGSEMRSAPAGLTPLERQAFACDEAMYSIDDAVMDGADFDENTVSNQDEREFCAEYADDVACKVAAKFQCFE